MYCMIVMYSNVTVCLFLLFQDTQVHIPVGKYTHFKQDMKLVS